MSQPTLAENRDGLFAQISLGFIAVLTAIVFFPLLRIFFAQDDFTLMYYASYDTGGMLERFFSSAPGQFRPLTKTFYFATMYKLFGLNASAFRFVSLALHITNILLVFSLLRRFGVTLAAALVATAFFALNVTFFDVIAWISCIQQLVAAAGVLLALYYAVNMIRTPSRRATVLCSVAYVISLLSMEQAAGLPVILVLLAVLNLPGRKKPLGWLASVKLFAAPLAIMGVYAAFMLLWKGIPQAGPYEFVAGRNVIANLVRYLSWFYHFWQTQEFVQSTTSMDIDPATHIPLAVALLYTAIFYWKRALFATAFTLVMLAPALFLSQHTFYLHTYVPAFGPILLLATPLQDLFRLRFLQRPRIMISATTVLIIVVGVLSTIGVRNNMAARMPNNDFYLRNFVLRRAGIAQNLYNDLRAKSGDMTGVQQVYMVYPRSGDTWNSKNVTNALGRDGAAVKLFFDRPDLTIEFRSADDPEESVDLSVTKVFYYRDNGTALSHIEVQEQMRKKEEQQQEEQQQPQQKQQ